ncbi:MAG: nuclear transport factor 2 family protein [Pseudobdellovibrio sp.]
MANEELNSNYKLDTVKKIYAALNQNDVSAYLNFFDTKIERFETFGGRYHGLEELKTNFSQGRDTWTEGSCEPEKFTIVDNKVVVFVYVRVRLKNKTDWIDGQVTDVFTFQSTKVVEFYSFADRNEALKWAGISKD